MKSFLLASRAPQHVRQTFFHVEKKKLIQTSSEKSKQIESSKVIDASLRRAYESFFSSQLISPEVLLNFRSWENFSIRNFIKIKVCDFFSFFLAAFSFSKKNFSYHFSSCGLRKRFAEIFSDLKLKSSTNHKNKKHFHYSDGIIIWIFINLFLKSTFGLVRQKQKKVKNIIQLHWRKLDGRWDEQKVDPHLIINCRVLFLFFANA